MKIRSPALLLLPLVVGCGETDLYTTTPALEVAAELNFGQVFVGDAPARALEIESVGTGQAQLTSIHTAHPDLELAPGEGQTIDPADALLIAVTWNAEEVGDLLDATIELETNVPGSERITIALSGVARPLPTCDDGNPCTDDSFLRAEERCTHTVREGACDDGSACTDDDTCIAGACVGAAHPCDDGVPCTIDLCDPTNGCRFEPDHQACVGEGEPACTIGSCDPAGGCSATMAPDGTLCGRVDCSMANVCFAGVCTAIDIQGNSEGMPCDDGDDCTTDDSCQDGACVGGNPIPLDPEPLCLSDLHCGDGQFCDWIDLERPQCGGYCRALQASYVLHEWGVNTPRVDGTATLRGGPTRWLTPYGGADDRKPVIYIYADGPLTIDVGVQLTNGISTETWPELPNGSSLLWDDVAVSQGTCELTAPPEPAAGADIPGSAAEDREIYQLCDWVVPSADCLRHGSTVSRLLFYTGELTGYQPPIAAALVPDLNPDDGESRLTFLLTNVSPATIGPVQLIHRQVPMVEGLCAASTPCPVTEAALGWGDVPAIEPGQTIAVPVTIEQLFSDVPAIDVTLPEGWLAMADALEQALADLGLYPEERAVFMTTWERMFFAVQVPGDPTGEPEYANGSFLLYPWSESHAGQTTPLTASPPPAELRRAIFEHQPVVTWVTGRGEVSGTVTLVEESLGVEPAMFSIPAVGATVAAWQNDELVQQTRTDDAGRYALALVPGSYEITAQRFGWEAGDLQEAVVAAGAVTVVNLAIYSQDMVDKPNIYLYPTETLEVDVRVELGTGCEVTVSDPEYAGGWQVTVEPSGLIDGAHTFLFYEAEVPRRYPLAEGWSVAAGEIESFFVETLDAYGLTAAERDDFVDYWTRHLEPAPHYAIYPLTDEAILAPLATLRIEPPPDSLSRLWLVIAAEDLPRELPVPRINSITRTGFTVVEWGVILR